jgi:hypothetical protein
MVTVQPSTRRHLYPENRRVEILPLFRSELDTAHSIAFTQPRLAGIERRGDRAIYIQTINARAVSLKCRHPQR